MNKIIILGFVFIVGCAHKTVWEVSDSSPSHVSDAEYEAQRKALQDYLDPLSQQNLEKERHEENMDQLRLINKTLLNTQINQIRR